MGAGNGLAVPATGGAGLPAMGHGQVKDIKYEKIKPL